MKRNFCIYLPFSHFNMGIKVECVCVCVEKLFVSGPRISRPDCCHPAISHLTTMTNGTCHTPLQLSHRLRSYFFVLVIPYFSPRFLLYLPVPSLSVYGRVLPTWVYHRGKETAILYFNS